MTYQCVRGFSTEDYALLKEYYANEMITDKVNETEIMI